MFFVVGCFGALVARWRQPRVRVILALLSCVLLPLSCVLGCSALQYLLMGGDQLPSNEVLVSFAHSHLVEALAAIVVLFSASSPKKHANFPPKPLPNTVVVVTWNVWFGSFERHRRWAAIIEQAAARRPDVICFQEVTVPFIQQLDDACRVNGILGDYIGVHDSDSYIPKKVRF